MEKKLLILGAGGYGSVVKEIAMEMNEFTKIDFLDDSYGEETKSFHEESIGKLAGEYNFAIVAIGDPAVRREWTEKLHNVCYFITAIVTPRAYVSPSAHIEQGVVIEPNATIMANTWIEPCSFISAGAVVNHNAYVSNFSHVDCNAVVMSGAFVSVNTWVQPGEVVRKEPVRFELTPDGFVAKPLPHTPVGDYNFDDVM